MAHREVAQVAVRLVDGLADVGVPQQQGDRHVGLLPSQRRAHRRAEGAAAEDNHLVCALQHRRSAAALAAPLRQQCMLTGK